MAFKASQNIEIRTQFDGIEANFLKVINAIKGITPGALLEILEPVLEQAQIYTPVKTGALRNSGYLEVVQTSGSVISAEIGFGRGGEPSYTVFVHEDMTKFHQPPTQAKFLQHAVDEVLPNIEDQILRKYKQGVVL